MKMCSRGRLKKNIGEKKKSKKYEGSFEGEQDLWSTRFTVEWTKQMEGEKVGKSAEAVMAQKKINEA